jgi:hypothetical protein
MRPDRAVPRIPKSFQKPPDPFKLTLALEITPPQREGGIILTLEVIPTLPPVGPSFAQVGESWGELGRVEP